MSLGIAGPGPLSDVTVVETGTGVAGAFCGLILRQLGARVVTFPSDRRFGDADADVSVRDLSERAYLEVGKEVVDSAVEGSFFDELVRSCDIVICGVDHSTKDTRSLVRAEYGRMKEVNPRIIFVVLTPFGVDASFDQWSGGDLHAQAISGWPAFVGNPSEAPLGSNYGGGALQHGLSAAAAALAAFSELSDRQTDTGEFVDVSGADVIGSSIRMYSHTYRLYGQELKRAGLRAPGSSGRYPHTAFPCKDGVVSIICRAVDEWRRFVKMLGDPGWASEPRYQDFYAMATQYPDEVDAFVRPWMLERTKAELSALAVEFKVPMAPIRTVEEALNDEQMNHREFFVESKAGGAAVRVPGFPALWKSERLRPSDEKDAR